MEPHAENRNCGRGAVVGMIVRNFGDSGGNDSDNVALAKLAVVVRQKRWC